MKVNAVAAIAVGTVAAGVGASFLGYRHFDRRPDESAVVVPLQENRTPPHPRPQIPEISLYRDDEVQRIVEKWSARDPADKSLLRLAPVGKSAPLQTVFGSLELDPARLGKPIEIEIKTELDQLVFLKWQLSPSFELSCLTANNDPKNKSVGYTDPQRLLYGIRIGTRVR